MKSLNILTAAALLGTSLVPSAFGFGTAPSPRFQGIAPRNQRQRRKALRNQRSNRFNKR